MTYEFGWQWRRSTKAAKTLALGMILTGIVFIAALG